MGTHSARHRPARKHGGQPDDGVVALLTRLGAAPHPGAAPTRHIARPGTARAQTPDWSRPPSGTLTAEPAGGTRCGGSAPLNPLGIPRQAEPVEDLWPGTDLYSRVASLTGPNATVTSVGALPLVPGPLTPAAGMATADVSTAPAIPDAGLPATPSATDADRAAALDALAADHDALAAYLDSLAPSLPVVEPEVDEPDGATAPDTFAERDVVIEPVAVENTGSWARPAAPVPPLPPVAGDAPAGLAPDDPAPARRSLRHLQPVVAALSVTAVGASAVLTATGLPQVTPSTDDSAPRIDAALAAAPQAGTSFTLPADPRSPATVTGPAAVLSAPSRPASGADIAATAAADAKAIADKAARDRAAAAKAAADKAAADRAAQARRQAQLGAPAPRPSHGPGGGTASGTGDAPAAATGNSIATRALALARSKMGKPYVWGAAGPSAFDCSGLVLWAYKQVGVSLPHSSSAQSTMGTPVSKANLRPGDLVFFYSPVSHVGIYVGNGMILNASQSGEPVKLSNMAYMPFHNARRITT